MTNNSLNVQGVIIGGCGDFKHELKDYNRLDYRLRDKVISVVDVSYGGENGLN